MEITWLGQAGLMFKTTSCTILVDPYLSDSVAAVNPLNARRVPVASEFLSIRPDVIILTHNHLDHTDPETLQHYLNENSEVTVLASANAWHEVRKFGGLKNNYVMFNRKSIWSYKEFRFQAVYAEHSDREAIGVVIFSENKTYYITGDTLYNMKIFEDIPKHIDYLFVPINGVGNNMNMKDAADFAEKINAKKVIPLHIGLFDSINAELFPCEKKIIPVIYQKIRLE